MTVILPAYFPEKGLNKSCPVWSKMQGRMSYLSFELQKSEVHRNQYLRSLKHVSLAFIKPLCICEKRKYRLEIRISDVGSGSATRYHCDFFSKHNFLQVPFPIYFTRWHELQQIKHLEELNSCNTCKALLLFRTSFHQQLHIRHSADCSLVLERSKGHGSQSELVSLTSFQSQIWMIGEYLLIWTNLGFSIKKTKSWLQLTLFYLACFPKSEGNCFFPCRESPKG